MSTDSKNHHIAITIEALGSQPVHHIDLVVTAGAVQDVRDSMIGSSEFYQSGSEVVNTDLHTPLKAGDVVGVPFDKLPLQVGDTVTTNDGASLQKMDDGTWLCYKSGDKPIYTQAMSDAGYLPPVGCICLVLGRDVSSYVDCEILLHTHVEGYGDVAIFTILNHAGVSHYYSHCMAGAFKPLDSRTDEDKAISDLDIAIDGRHTADVLDDIKADKITGVKWVGK